MVCRNLCERLYSKIIFGKSHYEGVEDLRFIIVTMVYSVPDFDHDLGLASVLFARL
jgi:hypothetical protein